MNRRALVACAFLAGAGTGARGCTHSDSVSDSTDDTWTEGCNHVDPLTLTDLPVGVFSIDDPWVATGELPSGEFEITSTEVILRLTFGDGPPVELRYARAGDLRT